MLGDNPSDHGEIPCLLVWRQWTDLGKERVDVTRIAGASRGGLGGQAAGTMSIAAGSNGAERSRVSEVTSRRFGRGCEDVQPETSSPSEVMKVFSTRLKRNAGCVVLSILVMGVLSCVSPGAQGVAAQDNVWDQIVEKVYEISLSSLREAVMVLRSGGPDAEALWSDPNAFVRSRDPGIREDALVMIIDMVANKALTPASDVEYATSTQPFSSPAWAGDYRLTEAAIAITGPERGLLIRRKMPVGRADQSFAEEATDLTFWVESSLRYIVTVMGRIEEEENLDRLEYFIAAPGEFLFEEAVRDGEWGRGLGQAFLEQAHILSYDVPRADGTDTLMFIPPGLLSKPGTVVVAVGFVDEEWCFVLELASIQMEDQG